MAGTYTYHYPRPGLTVDAVIVAKAPSPSVLLIKRGFPPYEGSWALPGGFVDENEGLTKAAARELAEETGLDVRAAAHKLRQVGTFGDPGRDPRGWTVTVAYAAVFDAQGEVRGGDDAKEAAWFALDSLPDELAFDHDRVLAEAFRRLGEEERADERLVSTLDRAARALDRRPALR